MLVKACQTSSLLLFKFWQGLYLLMSSYNLIYTMNFTMKYDIVPFSHILVHSKFRIFGLAEAQILSEPNLISTNERRDNIRPMRNGYYFPISGSHLRPAVYLGDFSFPLCHNFCTKKKIVGNIKLIDLNCNWLTVCPIYVNDCIYECMNAFNLQVSPHASAILQGGIVFFWSFDQSTEI